MHVLTLITPDGAYGGPARVAVNQASVLQSNGHQVLIAAGCAGFDIPPTEIDGIAVQLFPARRLVRRFGYAPTYARTMRSWLAKNIQHFDVVHIHLARDLVTAPAAIQVRNQGVPFVVQTHGMIVRDSHRLASLFDLIFTSRILKRASRALYLNGPEKLELARIGGPALKLAPLANGIPSAELDKITADSPQKGPLPEVLFFARLHPRKRPELFAQAAVALLKAGEQASFAIVGPPEGAEIAVDGVIASARAIGLDDGVLRRELGVPLEEAYGRLARASLTVLPSESEPFGMTIVESLALGIPVVVSRDGGLADFVEKFGCGLTVDPTVNSLATAIGTILRDPAKASQMGRRGKEGVRSEFNLSDIGAALEVVYQESVSRSIERL